MIIPSAGQVVRNLAKVFEQTIVPSLDGPQERSTAQTMRHMFRYLELRIENEGQTLLDELSKLNDVLAQVASHFEQHSDPSTEMRALSVGVRRTLGQPADPTVYPNLTIMAERVAVRREYVSRALAVLNEIERGPADDIVHDLLRNYLTWQITQEGRVVEPAFWGQGPRR